VCEHCFEQGEETIIKEKRKSMSKLKIKKEIGFNR